MTSLSRVLILASLVVVLAGLGCGTSGPQLVATKLAIATQPSNVVAGAAISPPVKVEARDGSNNLVMDFTGNVSVALGSNPGNATLSGTLSVAAVGGVATFSDLKLNNGGAGYTLVASASGLNGATSSAFDVTASQLFASIAGKVTGAVGSGVTVNLSGAHSASVVTGASGSYLFAALGNGNYTVTPSLAGFQFSPANRSVTLSGADVGNQDFVSTAVSQLGHIYVADTQNHRIVKMDDITGAGWVALGGTRDAGVGAFNGPSDVFLDSSGRIYVSDSGNGRIVRMDDMTGAGWVSYGTLGSGQGQFAAAGLFVDPGGAIYVADTGNNRVVRMNDMTGAGWVTLSVPVPVGIAVDSAGRIYASEYSANQILRVDDMAGANALHLGSTGSGLRQFASPRAVALDSQGRIYVADDLNERIARMDDITGAGWVTLVSTQGAFGGASGVSVTSSGRICVAGYKAHKISQMDDMNGTNFQFLGDGGVTGGSGVGQFKQPNGIYCR